MIRLPMFALLVSLLPLLRIFDHRIFDMGVEAVWNVDVLLVAEAHVGKIDEHHRNFILSYITGLTQIKDLKYVQIELLVFGPAKAS